jgi:hypothetical protein
VVAGGDDLGETRRPGSLQAGEEDGGLDLCGWSRRVEVDGVERAAVDRHRGVTFSEVDSSAHLGERLADTLHWADGERVVADKGEGVGVRCDQAGEHAHGRAGVAAVKRFGRLTEVPCGADHFDVPFMLGDGCTECRHAGERTVRVGSGGEVRQTAGTLGNAGEERIPVRDGLVAGQHDGALERLGRADEFGGHSDKDKWKRKSTLGVCHFSGRQGGFYRAGRQDFNPTFAVQSRPSHNGACQSVRLAEQWTDSLKSEFEYGP